MKWYKHDSNAHMDAKLQDVLLDYGLEGYGLYWYCLELIINKVDKDCATFELEHDARIIARNTGSTAAKVTDMMQAFISLGLFEDIDGKITCLKLAKRIDKSMTSNKEMRAIIELFRKSHDESPNNHDETPNSHDPVMTESAKPMQEEKRREESRVDKNKSKDLSASNENEDQQIAMSNLDSYEMAMSENKDPVTDIFNYWLEVMDKKSNTAFSDKRTKAIKKRLSDGYLVSDIKTAILNCSNTDHNMGRGPNSNGTKYNDIELICRHPEILERFRDNLGEGAKDSERERQLQAWAEGDNEPTPGETYEHDRI